MRAGKEISGSASLAEASHETISTLVGFWRRAKEPFASMAVRVGMKSSTACWAQARPTADSRRRQGKRIRILKSYINVFAISTMRPERRDFISFGRLPEGRASIGGRRRGLIGAAGVASPTLPVAHLGAH